MLHSYIVSTLYFCLMHFILCILARLSLFAALFKNISKESLP